MDRRPAIIVTGGTGALGRAVVPELLRRGARVAVPYTSEARFEELRGQAGVDESRLRGGRTDVADLDATRAFVDAAAAEWDGLDGLAALAGAWAGTGIVEDAPSSEWEAMLRVNLVTAYSVCRAALPHLLRGGGSIVLVSARAAQAGGAGAAGYAVAKAGVLTLARVLDLENRARGVRVNCVLPGTIDTPENRRAMPTADPTAWTSPEAIARVIAFLLSPESGAVSGAAIPVDGRA